MFTARLRKQSESIIITIPNEVVEAMKLKDGQIKRFYIKDIIAKEVNKNVELANKT